MASTARSWGEPGLTTSEVIAAGLPDTGSDPTDFVVPGAASVGPGGATALPAPPTSAAAVTSDTAAAGTPIAAGTALRVVSEAAPLPNGDRVLEVETLDAHPLGYVVASALVPRDSLSPTVTPIASELAITPNDDGMADRLILDARFSETVTWRFQIRSKAGATVYDANGKGAALAVDWDGMNKGAPIPDGTYPWSLTATDAWGNPPLARSGTVVRSGSIVLGPESTYVPLGPVRLLDSRIGNGLAGTFSARTPRVLQLTGRGGIPAGATAVTVNLTIVGQSAPGYVALTPTPTATPATSTLNVPAGDTRANGATVPLSASGSLALVYMAPAGARTHLLLDVTGYYTAGAGGATYVPLGPVRLLDSPDREWPRRHLQRQDPAGPPADRSGGHPGRRHGGHRQPHDRRPERARLRRPDPHPDRRSGDLDAQRAGRRHPGQRGDRAAQRQRQPGPRLHGPGRCPDPPPARRHRLLHRRRRWGDLRPVGPGPPARFAGSGMASPAPSARGPRGSSS